MNNENNVIYLNNFVTALWIMRNAINFSVWIVLPLRSIPTTSKYPIRNCTLPAKRGENFFFQKLVQNYQIRILRDHLECPGNGNVAGLHFGKFPFSASNRTIWTNWTGRSSIWTSIGEDLRPLSMMTWNLILAGEGMSIMFKVMGRSNRTVGLELWYSISIRRKKKERCFWIGLSGACNSDWSEATLNGMER